LKLRILAFQQAICSPFGGHLVGQPEENPQLLFSRLNPAHRTLGFYLDSQLNSKFHETLGHENPLAIVSNQGLKVYSRLIFEAIPAGQVEGYPGGLPAAFTPSCQSTLPLPACQPAVW